MARNDIEFSSISELARTPQIRLNGPITQDSLDAFLDQVGKVAAGEEPIAVEVTTTGGDAEIGRRLALEVKLARERLKRRLVFIGKTVVYSAGATVMGGFPKEDRYLTEDAVLLIHCRKLSKDLNLEGPLRALRIELEQVISEIDMGLTLQQEGYAEIVRGSSVSIDEVTSKAEQGWYIQASEAFERGLVAGLV
jgi:ATP-dependent protease ClpP protease subunit